MCSSARLQVMKTLNWKAFLAGFGIYFLATRPLLSYLLPGAPILLGTEVDPSIGLVGGTFFLHVIAAFAAGIATAAFAPGKELVAAPLMGAFLAVIDATRAIRLSQDPGERPGFLFMVFLFGAVVATCTAGGWFLARIRGRKRV